MAKIRRRQIASAKLEAEMLKAFRRLAGSSTRLTRRRGRKVLRQAVDKIFAEYPPLRVDGSGETVEVDSAQSFILCPLCKIPVLARVFPEHASNRHAERKVIREPNTCPCCDRRFKSDRGVAKHLAKVYNQGELTEHMIEAATKRAFEVNEVKLLKDTFSDEQDVESLRKFHEQFGKRIKIIGTVSGRIYGRSDP